MPIFSSPVRRFCTHAPVQRYAGLSVRRRIAIELREEWIARKAETGSPWSSLQKLAERFADDSGLKPWWVFDHAEIRRQVFERPFGRDMARFARLREQRMIYRLALGQPNQEDFIDVLSKGGRTTQDVLKPLVLDLSAMGLRQGRPGPAQLQLEPNEDVLPKVEGV